MCNQDETVNMTRYGLAASVALQKTSCRMFETQDDMTTGEKEAGVSLPQPFRPALGSPNQLEAA
jgi:hypothetical protein